jgi:hypothetical protein
VIVFNVIDKPCVTHGSHTVVIVANVSCTRPSAKIYRHKLHEQPTGWTKKARLEVQCIMEQLLKMVKEEAVDSSDSYTSEGEGEGDSNNQEQIFGEPPHFISKNYFADNKILNLLGGHGFGSNRIPVCCACHSMATTSMKYRLIDVVIYITTI